MQNIEILTVFVTLKVATLLPLTLIAFEFKLFSNLFVLVANKSAISYSPKKIACHLVVLTFGVYCGLFIVLPLAVLRNVMPCGVV
jgi:hypothetical protein